ncbi:MAG: integrase, partial [Thermoproteota archaeon]
AKYSRQYTATTYCYARKYHHLLYGNLRQLDFLKDSTKGTVVKALIVLSKFLGIQQQFKQRLLDYGVKIPRQDSFTSFLRILNNNNNTDDILKWYKEATSVLRDNEKTLLKFCLYSGLRKNEAITSFNRIIQLAKQNRLSEYYDFNLNCLMHFKYPKEFIRRTKNCFISFIPEPLIMEIANCKPVSYVAIRKRLERKRIKVRINELRDYFGTYLLQHGILEVEINLLQGRIPPSIFVKHYWSPKLSELKTRVFKTLNLLHHS